MTTMIPLNSTELQTGTTLVNFMIKDGLQPNHAVLDL